MFLRKEGTRLLVIGLGSLLASFAGLGSAKKDEAVKRLTPDDAGQEVAIKVEEHFEVTLPETPTSGYLWTVHRADADYLKLEREGYADPDPDKARVGVQRMKLFVFQALKEGRTKLELWLRRPWEKADQPIEAYEVTLKILPR